MKLKRILAAAFAGIMAVCCTGCAGQKSEPLKVGVKSDVIGFGFTDTVTNEYQGLEIEIAKKLATELGYSGDALIRAIWTAFSLHLQSPRSARRAGISPLLTSPTR